MFKEERYEKILEILNEENYISAMELSKRLFVSLPTIRRDLAELSSKNLILRNHGGARKISSSHVSPPLDFRKAVNYDIKRRLCEKACELINDNDVIFIDGSSTTLQLAEYITQKKSITVVTNGLPLAVALRKKGIKVYCTGGEIREESFAAAGFFAEEFIKNFNFDIMFFSCSCVTENGIIADTSLLENTLRRTAINSSKKVVFMCDSSKFNKTAPHNLVPICDADFVITDFCETLNFDTKNFIII